MKNLSLLKQVGFKCWLVVLRSCILCSIWTSSKRYGSKLGPFAIAAGKPEDTVVAYLKCYSMFFPLQTLPYVCFLDLLESRVGVSALRLKLTWKHFRHYRWLLSKSMDDMRQFSDLLGINALQDMFLNFCGRLYWIIVYVVKNAWTLNQKLSYSRLMLLN